MEELKDKRGQAEGRQTEGRQAEGRQAEGRRAGQAVTGAGGSLLEAWSRLELELELELDVCRHCTLGKKTKSEEAFTNNH